MDRRQFLHASALTLTSALMADHLMASGYKRSPHIKPIRGSWFEFYHHSRVEGQFWNPVFQNYTDDQWRAIIKDIHELGLEYLVLLSVADNGKTFYPSELQPRYDFVSSDPLEVVLTEADKYNIKFFVSNDFWADFRELHKMMTDQGIAALRAKGMEEVARKYAHHKSFYGWYFPNETGLTNTIDETTISYVNDCSKRARELTPHCINLIAPYGIKSIRFDDYYVKQLERLDIDIMAYQDEVGVRKTKAGTAGKYYEGLYKMHAKAGRARLWADMEVFEFEGNVYSSPLVSAGFDRVLTQMEDISPFVEQILIYQYCGLMNRPGSPATIDQPAAGKLYTEYTNWKKKQ